MILIKIMKRIVFAYFIVINFSFAENKDLKVVIGEKRLDSSWGIDSSMGSFGIRFSYFPIHRLWQLLLIGWGIVR